MTANAPKKPSRTWSPTDRLSIDKAIRNDVPLQPRPVEDTHLSHPARGQHPIKPTNHKPFNRQKKG